jgi:beta-glucosidase
MKYSAFRLLVPALLSSLTAMPATSQSPYESRIDALVAKMTLEEKLGQMSQATSMGAPISERIKEEIRKGRWGSFLNAGGPAERAEAQRIALQESRLGIPLIFGRDVIHGFRTVFPIPLGQAASWDPALIQQAARVAASEAAATGIHWTFAPMLDITRDPRWGRIAETLGEDPVLTSTLGAAMVEGFQGESLSGSASIAACAKHYVGYGAAEGGRDYNTTWIPEIQLREIFLRPFQAARKAGAATYMSAFNNLNGVPTSGNEFTLRQVLRNEWKFDGFVVSDWDSITEMIPHGYAADARDAARKGLRAGVDMEMVSTSYYDNLKALLAAGQIDIKLIDDAVRNILRVKFRLGLFGERQYTPAELPAKPDAGALDTARRIATESLVLLKNQGNTLPLAPGIGRVAVIGPLADSPVDQMGSWVMDGRPAEVVTPLAALRARLGDARVAYAPGLAKSRDVSRAGFAAAVEAARSADAVLLFLGEEQILSGEAHSRAFLDLPGAQEALVAAVAATGKPLVCVILAGRPLTFHTTSAAASAVLYAWHPGTMGGAAIAAVLFGDEAPSGKLPVTFPRTVGQVPIYYAHLNTGRPPEASELGIPIGTPVDPKGFTSKYLDVDFTPEYPFGFGLSYTTFSYKNLMVSATQLGLASHLEVSAEVTNTGSRAATEIVQFYIHAPAGSVARPVRELKAFRRVELRPGQTQRVSFPITAADLAAYNDKLQLTTAPGRYELWIAPDSTSGVRGEITFE